MLVYVFGLVLVVNFRESDQHGYMEKPPQRSSLWRYGYNTPPNYNDNELYCGGIDAFKLAEGKCGPCGDPYIGVRQHEAGGKYASGIIVEKLPYGAKELNAIVKVSSHHMGYFTFHICPHDDPKTPVTQECLDKTPLRIKEGSPEYDYFRYYPEEPWNRKDGDRYKLKVQLPTGLICSQCILQWTYITGNSWGTNKDGASCLGCGIQEEFRNCADISIGDPDVLKENNADPNMKNSVVDIPKQMQDVDLHVNFRYMVTEVPKQHTLIPPSSLKNKFELEKKLLERFRQRQTATGRKSHSLTQSPHVKRFSAAHFLRPGNERSKKRITTADTVFSWVENKIKNSIEPQKPSILKEPSQHLLMPEINLSKSANSHRENGNDFSIYNKDLESNGGKWSNELYPHFHTNAGKETINIATLPGTSTMKGITQKISNKVPESIHQEPKIINEKSYIIKSNGHNAQHLPGVSKDKEPLTTSIKSIDSITDRYSLLKDIQNTISDSRDEQISSMNTKNTFSTQIKELQITKPVKENLPSPRRHGTDKGYKPTVTGGNDIKHSSQPKFVFKNSLSKLATASKNQNKRQSWTLKDISTPRFVFEHSPLRRKKPATSTFSFINSSSIKNAKESSSLRDLATSTQPKQSTTTTTKSTSSNITPLSATYPVLKASNPSRKIMTTTLKNEDKTIASPKRKVADTEHLISTISFKNTIESTTHPLKVKSTVLKMENQKTVTTEKVQIVKEAHETSQQSDTASSSSNSPRIRFKEFPLLNTKAKFAPTFRYEGSISMMPVKVIPSNKSSRLSHASRAKFSAFKNDLILENKSSVFDKKTLFSMNSNLLSKHTQRNQTEMNRTESSTPFRKTETNLATRSSKSIFPTSMHLSTLQTSTFNDRISTQPTVSTEASSTSTLTATVHRRSPLTTTADYHLPFTTTVSIQASVTPARETVSRSPVRRTVQMVGTKTSDMSSAYKMPSNLTHIIENKLSGSKIVEFSYDRLNIPMTTPDGDVFVTNLSENKVTAPPEIKNNNRKDVYIEHIHQKQEIFDKNVEVRQIQKSRTTLAPTTIRRYMPENSRSLKTKKTKKTKEPKKPIAKKTRKAKKGLTLRQIQEVQRRYNRALKVLEILKKKPKALLRHPIFAGHKISNSAVRKLIKKMEAAKRHIKRMLNSSIQLSL